jgi:hypothetical protein
MTIQEHIIKTAQKYLNEKEIPDNRGWYNKALQKVFELVGWRKGQHWCAYAMELVWKEAYKEYFNSKLMPIEKEAPISELGNAIFKKINNDVVELEIVKTNKLLTKLCSGNSQKTFRNFDNSDDFETGKHPALGAAVIYKYSGSSGHTAAAVVSINLEKQTFDSIEGNSKNKFSLNKHKFNEPNRLGFIYPKEF